MFSTISLFACIRHLQPLLQCSCLMFLLAFDVFSISCQGKSFWWCLGCFRRRNALHTAAAVLLCCRLPSLCLRFCIWLTFFCPLATATRFSPRAARYVAASRSTSALREERPQILDASRTDVFFFLFFFFFFSSFRMLVVRVSSLSQILHIDFAVCYFVVFRSL
jgi:Ca2+/Na+ antiporter